jgi:hypothetical protein
MSKEGMIRVARITLLFFVISHALSAKSLTFEENKKMAEAGDADAQLKLVDLYILRDQLEEAKIIPQKFLGSWTALSRNHMAISGDMVLSQNQIEFSKKGLVPCEVIELRANQVYLKLGREPDDGVYMRIGPIKKDQWLEDHYQMEVAYYKTKESLWFIRKMQTRRKKG